MTTIEVTHCSGCPFGRYYTTSHSENYDCLLSDSVSSIISYFDDPELITEKPVPDTCPLRKEPITITINTTTK